ncbi:MAG TPA: FGGY family carbohydrate kinase [Phycisphaerae bacterium]|nr:FGGY family carbohydrate kinase [Phycisphaerae bacterium]
MRVLAIDVGSSSIKTAYCKNGRIKKILQIPVQTQFDGTKVVILASDLLCSFEKAIRSAMHEHKKLDAIAIDTFSPGLVGLDRSKNPILGCITHQDRRSVAQAAIIEKYFGIQRCLELTGNRPFPGGIASSSLLWFKQRQSDLFKKLAYIGQTSSLLVHHLTGQWVIDPSQAAFSGLYDSNKFNGWVDEFCKFIGVRVSQLPRPMFADQIAGKITATVAQRLGLPEGCPVLPGIVDTSAAVLSTDCRPGRLVHSTGSTDVLALCLEKSHPAADILSRPIGTGKKLPRRWLAVSTIAAAGSTMKWMNKTFFSELSTKRFHKLADHLEDQMRIHVKTEAPSKYTKRAGVIFHPYLAGDRTSMDLKTGAFENLTLATEREEMLSAVIEALAQSSRERFMRLQRIHAIRKEIFTMGGQVSLANMMHRHWPGKWRFTAIENEAISGLVKLANAALS